MEKGTNQTRIVIHKSDARSFYKSFMDMEYIQDIAKLQYDETDPEWIRVYINYEKAWELYMLGRRYQLNLEIGYVKDNVVLN